MKRAVFAPFLLMLTGLPLFAQRSCNDDTILNMWKAQTTKDDATIVAFIQAPANANCDYSLAGIKSLMDSQVSTRVIAAMLEKVNQGTGAAPPSPAPPRNPPFPPTNNEAAVYFRTKDGPWSPMLAESIDFTSNTMGATMRKYTTFGARPRSLQMHAFTEGSKTTLPNQPEIVINIPPGASINNYLLTKLRAKGGQRHLHLSSNKKNDLAHAGMAYTIVASDQAKGQYKIALPFDTSPGEYGIYDVNSVNTDQGKLRMYTFRVLPQ